MPWALVESLLELARVRRDLGDTAVAAAVADDAAALASWYGFTPALADALHLTRQLQRL